MKHTPGPWVQPVRYSPEDGSDIPCGAIENRNGRSIAVCSYDQTPTVTAANARLIAAAPRLLEALQTLVNAANPCKGVYTTNTDQECEAARAAIAEAIGE